jgi:hypothetical protein
MSDLLKINVNEHTEKKNNLTYLSWAWAWAEVLKIDPLATWEVFEFNGMPACFLHDTSAMVKTAVTIKGHTKTCWLPVMDHKNKAIKNPDAFAINTAIVRCLTKTISIHGLGLYIYAGEDLPEAGEPEPVRMPENILADWLAYVDSATSVGDLKNKAAEAEEAAAADPDALAKIRAAVATKLAKAKPVKEAA